MFTDQIGILYIGKLYNVMELYTIGHSNHSIEAFIKLLQDHQITALADVRSHPYSRYLPHFNKTPLQQALKSANIHYVFLGQELGARPNNPECYIDGKAVYEKIAATEAFQVGINRILKGVNIQKISLMCAEKDPFVCHRAILICQYLRNQPNLQIHHIKSDNSLESHQELENRLLAKYGFQKQLDLATSPVQLSIFADHTVHNSVTIIGSRAEYLQEAYKLHGDEIAYQEKSGENHESGN